MRQRLLMSALLAVFAAAVFPPGLRAQSARGFFLDVESGGAFLGYCDVQIPGTSAGTRFSLTDDLEASGSTYFRIRAGLRFRERHSLWVLAAPLSLDSSGELPYALDYNGVRFPAGTSLRSTYRFNSWRLSYQYRIKESQTLKIGLGFTAKIRDAGILVEGGGQTSEKTNVGFVPIINFLVDWRFSPDWGLLVEGDALAAPQGRAEDVFLGFVYHPDSRLSLRLGYRLLEGGADNDEVYNFALVNYLSLGATYRF